MCLLACLPPALCAAAAASAREGRLGAVVAALAADDECRSRGAASQPSGSCAWSALQVGARLAREEEPVPLNATRMPPANSSAAMTPYTCFEIEYAGPPQGPESCFCHKAANSGCRDQPCSCKDGCTNVIAGNQLTVTFLNWRRRSIHGCPAAMVSIPRPFIRDISDLRKKCGFSERLSLLASMLTGGFDAYQAIARGPVLQCIHKAAAVSVHWLHVHTFCLGGEVDGLPDRANSLCATMGSPAQAIAIATRWVG